MGVEVNKAALLEALTLIEMAARAARESIAQQTAAATQAEKLATQVVPASPHLALAGAAGSTNGRGALAAEVADSPARRAAEQAGYHGERWQQMVRQVVGNAGFLQQMLGGE